MIRLDWEGSCGSFNFVVWCCVVDEDWLDAGDSYICLNTYAAGNAKRYNLHFWLGKDTSKVRLWKGKL